MQLILKPILIISCLCALASAQFRLDVPTKTLPSNLNGELDTEPSLSLFDPARFDISHGFSMQMMSIAGKSVSMTGFTNQITYLAQDNLNLFANVTLFKTQMPFQQQGLLINHLDISYDAGITFQPTKNSFLEFRIQKIPHYQRHQAYSPFNPRIIK